MPKRTKLPRVELHKAATWMCDECGAENLCRIIEIEGEDMYFISNLVICYACETEYRTDIRQLNRKPRDV